MDEIILLLIAINAIYAIGKIIDARVRKLSNVQSGGSEAFLGAIAMFIFLFLFLGWII
jgi:hypothetical protein